MERVGEREIEAELGRLVLPKVKGLGGGEAGDAEGAAAAGEVIGAGAYGVVMKVEVNGVPCIAKRLHGVLVGKQFTVTVAEKKAILSRFKNECVLLSRLRHPNIVQFMGVHYGAGPYDLSLVMEQMYMDLDKCLAENPGIPAPIKVSILLDTSYGLLHLHSQDPPIVHRDLNAANILLTPDMRAKIADLGVSKILNPQQLGQHKNTTCPGAHGFMAPEALKPHPDYTTKLDCFSFGIVSLYVANQEYPNVDETSITTASTKAGTIQLQKRNEAVKKMGEKHFLSGLIRWCMQDNPSKRASAEQINTSLKDLKKKHPQAHSDRLQMQAEINKELESVTDELQRKIFSLDKKNSALKEYLEKAHRQLEQCKQEKEEEKKKLEKLQTEMAVKSAQVKVFEEDFEAERNRRIKAYVKLDDMKKEYEEMKKDLSTKRAEVENVGQLLIVKQQQFHDHLETIDKQHKDYQEKMESDLAAKAAQVKQYHKQTMTFKEQVEKLAKEREEALKDKELTKRVLEDLRKKHEADSQIAAPESRSTGLFAKQKKKKLKTMEMTSPVNTTVLQEELLRLKDKVEVLSQKKANSAPVQHVDAEESTTTGMSQQQLMNAQQRRQKKQKPGPQPQLIKAGTGTGPEQKQHHYQCGRQNEHESGAAARDKGSGVAVSPAEVSCAQSPKRKGSIPRPQKSMEEQLPDPIYPPAAVEYDRDRDRQREYYDREGDNLMLDLGSDIQDNAEMIRGEVGPYRDREMTLEHVPCDPNLICPYCQKMFRKGEIQKFKRHVASCKGSTADGTVV